MDRLEGRPADRHLLLVEEQPIAFATLRVRVVRAAFGAHHLSRLLEIADHPRLVACLGGNLPGHHDHAFWWSAAVPEAAGGGLTWVPFVLFFQLEISLVFGAGIRAFRLALVALDEAAAEGSALNEGVVAAAEGAGLQVTHRRLPPVPASLSASTWGSNADARSAGQ